MLHPPPRVLAKAIRLPSGDHAGVLSSAYVLSGVSADCALPSAFITQMRQWSPPSSRWYAIFVPSGDQSGRPPRVVTSVGVPPAAGTTATRQSEVNAIFVPSGDQFGEWSDAAPVTSAVWPVPSATPEWVETKAMRPFAPGVVAPALETRPSASTTIRTWIERRVDKQPLGGGPVDRSWSQAVFCRVPQRGDQSRWPVASTQR